MSIRFTAGECWSYRGKRLRFECDMGNGLLFFREAVSLGPFQIEDDDGDLRAPDIDWALAAFAQGELKKERLLPDDPVRREAAARDIDPEGACQTDPRARLRLRVLRALDALPELPRSDRAFRIAVSKIWAGDRELAAFQKPSPSAVRRWVDQRGTPGDRPLNQMVSLSGRVQRRKRLPTEVHEQVHLAALWYWSSRRWTFEAAYTRLRTQLASINGARQAEGMSPLPVPSHETLRKTIRSLESYEVYREKYGAGAAATRFKAVEGKLHATRILQIGAIDHTTLDGVAIIDQDFLLPVGRPQLTVLMDVYSSCVVGFFLSFEPASIYSVVECIRCANRPKVNIPEGTPKAATLRTIFGRFDEIISDNGKEFSGVAMHDGLSDAGISFRLAPIKSPTYKPNVERFFEILNAILNRKLPGGVLKPETLRELGYDPRKDAALTIDQIEELIWQALTIYHIEPPRGGRVPRALTWQEGAQRHGIDVIGDDSQLGKMLGKVKYPCLITKAGVEIFGLRYHDPGLVSSLLEDLAPREPVRSRRKGSATARVKVKCSPANISEIHVWNKIRNIYVTLPALDYEYTRGISIWHHEKIKEWTRKKGLAFSTEDDRLRARASLQEMLQELAPKLKGKELRAYARLASSPRIQAKVGADVNLAYAMARPDGMAPPLILHETLAADRSDGGAKPSRPARRVKPKSQARRRSSASGKSPTADADELPDFSVDLSTWKEADL